MLLRLAAERPNMNTAANAGARYPGLRVLMELPAIATMTALWTTG